MTRIATDILVVGGGAAGMSAAVAAAESRNLSVTVIDDNPRLGGQIWRAELSKTKSPEAGALISALDNRRVQIVISSQVFAAVSDNCLAAESPTGRTEFEFNKLIIATGARERFLPFPGWTLPGVFGAGGLQALVKGGLNIEHKRVIVAGTGPLLLAVADYLKAKGAHVLAIVEQTHANKIRRFARSLWRTPSKMIEAAAMRARLIGVPYWTDSWITKCRGPRASGGVTSTAIEVEVLHRGKTQTLACDYLACGFHLVPNVELASLIGCEIENGFVAVDEFQLTSVENVFCAGEPTGIGGVEASLVEGKIAGYAATGLMTKAREYFAARSRTQKFADALNRTFALRDELRGLANGDTIICRCEDVEFSKLANFDSFREAKLQTRCGMGACQGRVCGAATEFLFDWQPGAVRPPIFPVKMENL